MRIVTDISLSLCEIARILGSKKHLDNRSNITGIVTDSRSAKTHDLFIALNGSCTSGEEYIASAKMNGAYILSATDSSADFFVSNTENALLQIASYYKSKLPHLKKTIGITGSVGKTTVKNILNNILSGNFKTHATNKNFNNTIGLSHTILTAPIETEYLICELGMNHLGEISKLSKALKPDIAVITNVGTAHIGNLGSRDLIAKAKLEILDGMSTKKIIVPKDEPLLYDTSSKTFSLSDENADYYLKPLLVTNDGSIFDIITTNGILYELNTNLPGRNPLIAIVIVCALLQELGLNSNILYEQLPNLNFECVRGKYTKISNFYVFDDTYSSSPEAVISDFEQLMLKPNTVKSCVLGDMLELGAETNRLHMEIGAAAYQYGFRKLYLFGAYSDFFAKGAKNAGMRECDIYINTDTSSPEITAQQVINNILPGEILLVKASHALHAERIIHKLSEN